ncbi:MAG: hypothetical protein Sapg2KO_31370 [Saprospiraceae bacterium]
MQAQFGVNAGYQVNQIDGWIIDLDGIESGIDGNGLSFGIDYWFRLKNKRIEFQPELNYSSFKASTDPAVFDYNIELFSFYFNTNIYLLDLLNDCNCPTFSKQNNFFKKGFFIRISPGLTAPNFEFLNEQEREWGNLQPNLGLGVGIDIGITDIVTLTPIITGRFMPQTKWLASFPGTPLDPNTGESINRVRQPDADIWQYNAGLRIGIRLDNW